MGGLQEEMAQAQPQQIHRSGTHQRTEVQHPLRRQDQHHPEQQGEHQPQVQGALLGRWIRLLAGNGR